MASFAHKQLMNQLHMLHWLSIDTKMFYLFKFIFSFYHYRLMTMHDNSTDIHLITTNFRESNIYNTLVKSESF